MSRFFFLLLVTLAVWTTIPQSLLAQNVKQVAAIFDPADVPGDEFGASVAIQDSTAVVGASSPIFSGQTGYAYVFVQSQGSWKQAARLSDGLVGDQFGAAVAIGNHTIAVSAPFGDDTRGAVHIFTEPAGGWSGDLVPIAELSFPSAGSENQLGVSLAISSDGSVLAAGGPGGRFGAVYVWVEPAGGWVDSISSDAQLSSSDGGRIGVSLAMSGNTIVAGEVGTPTLQAAYVFNKPPDGWSGFLQPSATLTASDGNSYDEHFSSSVAISGTTIAVGAPFHNFKPGTVYVYAEPNTGWQDMTQTAELSVPVNFSLQLGASVAAARNIVLAGAPTNTIGRNGKQGSVIGYLKPTSGWKNTTSPNGAASASDGQAGEQFGSSIAISGNNVIVGAPDDGDDLEGAAYIFSLQ